ncbi:MAG TPA: serine/threonine-protein kinase [Terriglobales bacterium]|jgi:serine/threonine protein kinase|nr:serine/threonine-protein kinase [Terriglobales bacterium]
MSTLRPDRWREVSPYLDEALSLDVEDRVRWLEDFRASHPELAGVVKKLLDEHDRLAQEHFLERAPAVVEDHNSLAGQNVGSYRIISPIGQGGMGSVWLAERSDGRFERRVAIKFLHFSLAAAGTAERFKREGKILGQLAHPHIAELIDAGVTPRGDPYLVLEYVDGEKIDVYCDKHKLDLEARLQLFLNILSAVAQAHSNLIVHRDIKPSNVLARNDGQVKLLDFGIAKLLEYDNGTGPETLLTVEGGGALTPQFAAPEQITGGGVTTATDIYALGVLLYLLLVGQHPAGPDAHSPAGLFKAIVDIDPAKGSYVIAATDSRTVAENRASTPEKLCRQLRGDLDTILAKALKKNPAERYGSVTALGDDLQRYLKHEPIRARPDSFTYRTAKFVRRNRGSLVTAGVVALVLIAAAVISIRQSIRASKEATAANREAAVAEAVNDFLQNDLLAQASAARQSAPGTNPDPDLKVRTALDRAAQRIEGKFVRQPAVEAAIRTTIGQTYQELGLYPEARKQLERALELQRRLLGEENPKTLHTKNLLGWTAKLQGKYPEAEALLTQTLTSRRRVLGPEHRDTLSSMNNLAVLYIEEGKYAQAEALDSQTLEIRRRVLGPDHPETLMSISNLAEAYSYEGKYAQAETLDNQALDVKRRVLGPEHPETLISIGDLADLYYQEGKYAQAEVLGNQVLEVRRRVLGPEHHQTLSSMILMAIVYHHEGKFAQAETLDNQVLEVQRRVLGPEHPDTLASMNNLAVIYSEDGKYAQAEVLDTEVLQARRRLLGAEHSSTVTSMNNLADDYAEEGKYAQAEALFNQALDTARRVEGPEHPDTLLYMSDFAGMYQRKGNYAMAQEYTRQALAGRRHVLGSEDPDTMASAADLALAYVSQGKFALSEPLAREAMETGLRKEPDGWQPFRAESLLGASLAGQKKYAEAEPLLLGGYHGMVARKGRIGLPDRYHLQLAHRWIVQLYKDWGKPGNKPKS